MKHKKFSCAPLIQVIKRELKVQSLTYREVAKALGTSENGVKLRFAHQRLSMEHVMAIADLLGLTVSELMRKVEQPPVRQFSIIQETRLLSNLRLLLVAVRIMDHWTIEDIVATYEMTTAECTKHLLELERIGLIELLPNNRIRKLVARGVDWVPDGPFHRFFAAHVQSFLQSRFDGKFESRLVLRATLTPAAIEQFQGEMRQLAKRLSDLHEECLNAPAEQRHRIVAWLAERPWELDEFIDMERKAPLRSEQPA